MKTWPVLGFIFLVVSCASYASSSDPWEHPWFEMEPLELQLQDLDGHEVTDVWEVTASQHRDALSFLEIEPWVSLAGHDQGKKLFGVPLSSLPPTDQLYLVRALYLNGTTGGFRVLYYEDQLMVHHSCLGHRFPPVTRTALLIALPRPPKRVYVSCSMDE